MLIDRRAFLLAAGGAALADNAVIDLTNAKILLPPDATPRMQTYVTLFTEESGKRGRSLWRSATGPSRIVLSIDHSRSGEGLDITSQGNEVTISGHSERGLLFGIGQLLRNIDFSFQRALLPRDRAHVSSTPAYRLRGHQLGYRPKTNSYDGWNVADWHQYIRDLAVFGVNTIESLPPHTDDDASSPHFPLPPEQMMVEVSRLADLYGLDVWMWCPAMGDGYGKSGEVEDSCESGARFLRNCLAWMGYSRRAAIPETLRPPFCFACSKSKSRIFAALIHAPGCGFPLKASMKGS